MNIFIRKWKKTCGKKLRDRRGFSLAEMLVTLMIIGLVTAAIAGGSNVVQKVYRNVTVKANAEVAESTAIKALQNYMRFAGSYQDSAGGNTFVDMNTGFRMQIYNNTRVSPARVYVRYYAADGSAAGATGTNAPASGSAGATTPGEGSTGTTTGTTGTTDQAAGGTGTTTGTTGTTDPAAGSTGTTTGTTGAADPAAGSAAAGSTADMTQPLIPDAAFGRTLGSGLDMYMVPANVISDTAPAADYRDKALAYMPSMSSGGTFTFGLVVLNGDTVMAQEKVSIHALNAGS